MSKDEDDNAASIGDSPASDSGSIKQIKFQPHHTTTTTTTTARFVMTTSTNPPSLHSRLTSTIKIQAAPYGNPPSTFFDIPNLPSIWTFGIAVILAYAVWKVFSFFTSHGGSGAKRRSHAASHLLLLGRSNSGKTTLFYKLLQSSASQLPPTVPSLNANSMHLAPTAPQTDGDDDSSHPPISKVTSTPPSIATSLTLTDFPGHLRLLSELKPLLAKARGILFVIDSTDKAMIKSSAEQLYDFFLNKDLTDFGIPILIVSNKNDTSTAKTASEVTDDLNRELERLRKSRAAALEGDDEASRYLGVEGRAFDLTTTDSPLPVTVCSISALKGDGLKEVIDFINGLW